MKNIWTVIILLLAFGLSVQAQDYEIITKKGKMGVKSKSGEILVKPVYDHVYYSADKNDIAFLERKWEMYLYIMKTQQIKHIPGAIDRIYTSGDTAYIETVKFFRFEEKGRYGILEFPHKILVEPTYDMIYPIDEPSDRFIFQTGKKYMIADADMQNKTPWFEMYDDEMGLYLDGEISYLFEGVKFLAEIEHKMYLMDMNGDRFMVENTKFSDMEVLDLEYVYYPTSKNGKYGYVNYDGETLLDFNYDNAFPFFDMAAPVKKDGKFGMIDLEGNPVIFFAFDSLWVEDYFNIMVRVGETEVEVDWDGSPANFMEPTFKKNKFGYVPYNKKKPVIPYVFDGALEFSEGLAAVNVGGIYKSELEGPEGGKWGYILPTGDFYIECQFDSVDSFYGGKAFVTKDEHSYYINTKGECVEDCP